MPDITWWGHATVTIADSGTKILTDPILTAHVGLLRRRRGPVPTVDAEAADAVLISHLHGDHLHLPSLRKVASHIPIVLPRGASAALPGLRSLRHRTLVELSAGEIFDVGPIRLCAIPARHDSRRHNFSRRGSASPLGFVIEGTHRTYFAGDTALYPELAAEVGPCDVALLPVGGWGPGLGPGHLDPATAAQAAREIGAADVVPIHFGTLWPIGCAGIRPQEFLRPGQEFVDRVAGFGPGVRVHLMVPGQTKQLPRCSA